MRWFSGGGAEVEEVEEAGREEINDGFKSLKR